MGVLNAQSKMSDVDNKLTVAEVFQLKKDHEEWREQQRAVKRVTPKAIQKDVDATFVAMEQEVSIYSLTD